MPCLCGSLVDHKNHHLNGITDTKIHKIRLFFTVLISMSLLRFKSLNKLGAKNREKSQHLNNLSQSNNSIYL